MRSDRSTTRLAIAAGIFGVATLIVGALALFGGEWVQEAAGQVVAFVLWFNVLMSLAYLAAALLIYRKHPLAQTAAWAIALATALVFAAFLISAASGTPFEARTVGAMLLRIGFWVWVAVMLRKSQA